LFSGRTFGAAEAASLGLVSRVVADEKVREEARALAQVFARKSRAAMRLGRAAFRCANEYGRGIADAVETFCEAAGTAEAQEGVYAFMEKRAPNW
jgi:enoyl-CoA hydratase